MVDPSLQSTTSSEVGAHGPEQPSNAVTLKRELPDAINLVPTMNKKTKGDQDPENHDIYRLRNKENKGFDEVARIMNRQRAASGKTPNFTSNAIYSRYKRNAAQIAAYYGETFQPCQLDIDAGTAFNLVSLASDFDKHEDDLLVQAYLAVMEDTWKNVVERIKQLGGRHHEPEMCARRCAQLGMR